MQKQMMETNAANQILTSLASSGSTSSDKMNYALQVALQTLKERCIQLQRRVSNMEEENQRLREGTTSFNNSNNQGQANVNIVSLRSQVDDLQRQKEQLEDQINMVSNENRRLWTRLSKISKDQPQITKEEEKKSYIRCAGVISIGTNQSLIRSKTFTQHSPNPHLRQKMISEVSVDDIVLDEFDPNDARLGYPCIINADDASAFSELDANIDAKHCMEGLQDLRREAMKQQQQLNSALTHLETRTALHPCPECAKKAASKPEMADKSLETEESSEPKQYSSEHTTSQHMHNSTFTGHKEVPIVPASRLNIIEEKLNADSIDKTCPMCGKLYSDQVSFKAFQEHVEMHFIDDTLEVDSGSMERHFEFISHAVGDF